MAPTSKLTRAQHALLLELARWPGNWVHHNRSASADALVAAGSAEWDHPWLRITPAGRRRAWLLARLAKRGVGRGSGGVGSRGRSP